MKYINRVLGMGSWVNEFADFCCEFSEQQLTHYCEQHEHDCPDIVLYYDGNKFVLRGSNAHYEAFYCPSCGQELNKVIKE